MGFREVVLFVRVLFEIVEMVGSFVPTVEDTVPGRIEAVVANDQFPVPRDTPEILQCPVGILGHHVVGRVANSEHSLSLVTYFAIEEIDSGQVFRSLQPGQCGNGGKQVDRVRDVGAACRFNLAGPRNHDRCADAVLVRRTFTPLSEASPEFLVGIVRVGTAGGPAVIADVNHNGVLAQLFFLEMR